jgi:hypothetical protein
VPVSIKVDMVGQCFSVAFRELVRDGLNVGMLGFGLWDAVVLGLVCSC